MALIELSAMDLPEIRHYLAELLTKPELAAAARVCKSWHKSFTPFLYREIRYAGETVDPPVESIEANAEYIRAVHFLIEPLDLPLEALTKLELMDLDVHISNQETWTRLAALLWQNPQLHKVVVKVCGVFVGDIHGFMEALARSCPNLNSLNVRRLSLDGECTRLLLDTAVRLKVLKIVQCEMVPPDTMDRWPVFGNLQELGLKGLRGFLAEQQQEILRKSPQLKSLVWYIEDGYKLSKFPEIIAAHLPHLERLRLWDSRRSVLDISSVLDSCQKLLKLTLLDCKVDAKALRSLTRHSSHLTYLDIELRCGITSVIVQQVMTCCPQLDYLKADALNACDILGVHRMDTRDTSEAGGSNGDQQATSQTLRPQLWACTSLRSLSVYICGLESKPVEWHREVLRQLSRLTKLEKLRVGVWIGGSFTRDGLDLRLESGLGLLSSLNIRKFGFDGLWQDLEERDVRWMVETWPRLSFVYGMLHHEQHKELECILKERNIEFDDFDAEDKIYRLLKRY